jgi:PAS domain S-box-containing protein
VVAFRTEEVPTDHPLRKLGATDQVVLAPLAPAEIRDLVESMSGAVPPAAVELVVRLSHGSPFMASEVLRGLVETGALTADERGWQVVPDLLADAQASSRSAVVFSRRLEQAPPEVLDLLSVGAVLGKAFPIALAAALAEQGALQAMNALADARRRHIVWADAGGERCVFTHDKLREALLERLPRARRSALHRAAAISLEERDASLDFELAYHFDAAGEHARALPYAVSAATTARSRYALEIAERQYGIAARGATAPAVQREIAEGLGEVAMLRGHYDDASVHFAVARDLCDTDLLAAGIEGKLGELAFKRGDVRGARDLLVRALRLLGARVPRRTPEFVAMLLWQVGVQAAHSALPRLTQGRRSLEGAERERLAMRLHSALAHAYWFGSGLVRCGWTHLRGMNLAECYPATPELAKAYSEHAPVTTMVPWCKRGIVYAEKSLAIRRDLGDTWGEGQSLNFYGVVLYAAGRFEEVLEKCGAAVAILERTGDQWEVNTANWNIALALYRLGRMDEAIAIARRVHAAGVALGDHQASGISLGAWAKAAGGAIPWDIIEAQLAHPPDDVHTRLEVLQAQALRLIHDRRIDDAVDILVGADTYLRRSGLRQEYVAPVRPWLLTALRMQLQGASPLDPATRRRRIRRARRSARRARRLASSYRNNLPHALRESALVESIAGRRRRARRLLERSLSVATGQGARHECAQTLFAQAEIDAARGVAGAAEELELTRLTLAAYEPTGVRELAAAAPANAATDVTLSLADRFASVLDAGRRIASALTEEAVFAAVREAAATLLRGERNIVVVLGENGRPRVGPLAGAGFGEYSRAVIERACRTGATVIPAEADLRRDASDSPELETMRSVLCAPISVRGHLTACLYVTHDQVGGLFGEEEDRLASFIAVLAGAALENAEGFSEVRALSTSLERRVAERTAQLSAAKERVEEAQHVAGVGSWEWDIAGGTVEWSDEMRRIYGVESGAERRLEDFLAMVDTRDRASMQATVEAALASHKPFSVEHRIVRSDGVGRILHARGEVIVDAAGRPVRMLGSGQDITERKAAEASRGRLAAVVDFSEDAIIAKTLDGVIESWNRGAQELFGYTADEVVGKSVALLVPPERQDELAGLLANIKRGRRVDPLETVRVTKDGRAIDVSLRVSLVSDAAGRLIGASSITRDITRQKRLEAELRRTGRYFDLSRDLTVAADFDGRIRSVNPALEQILGWSVEEFLARPFLDIVHPDDRDATRDEVAKLAGGAVAASFANRCAAKDGTYRWLDWNAIVPSDEPLIYAAARDVTERRRAEAALAASQRRTRQILETAHNAFVAVDERGLITEWNPEAERTFGWTRAEALGRELAATIVPPEQRAQHRLGLAGFVAGGEGRFLGRLLELSALHRDGHEFPVELTISSMETDDGYAFHAFMRDVSERHRSEEELRRSKRLLADLVEAAPDAVIITDARGRITLVNEQTERLFDYGRAELLGAPIEKLLPQHVDDRRGSRDQEPGTAPAKAWGLDVGGRRRDGTDFPVDISLSAVKTSEGTLTTAFVRDFTERKRTQDLLAGAHEKALEASRLKSEFVANMSHEIRTPLNGVIGMAGLLLDTALDGEQREYAEAIDGSADALMAVISDILDFSKIEAGKLELDRHRFDLRELVEGVSSMLAGSAHEKDLELIVWLADDLPGAVYGDAGRIRQVLANLVTNAVKFTQEGEIVVRVTSEGHDASTIDARFAVSDTGIGLEASALDRIFGAFSQADSSTTRRYGGSGLGLTISKQLVGLMEGQMGVESVPGKGSTFWFTVPVRAISVPGIARRTRELAGTRVLVVDDNARNLTVLARQLSALGMICDTAADSAEAMRKLAAAGAAGQSYALAIIDYNMPVTDGVGLAKAVRADPELSSVRLVMMTSSGSGRAGAARAGVAGFVTKPVREGPLLSEIARVLDDGPKVRQVDAPRARRRTPRPAASIGPAILVAEDNTVNQRVATRMLERRGFRVDVASDGREAVEMHRRGRYDLILMDCQMPELDGYAATAEIRRSESAPNRTPIVAMTANTLRGDRERCLAAGMDDYIGKPLRASDLEDVLARALATAGAAPAGPVPVHRPIQTAQDDLMPAGVPVLDPSRLADAYGDDEPGRADTVSLFLYRARTVIHELAGSIAAGDTAAAARAAHGLKGSSAVVGAVRLSGLAGTLYDALVAGSTVDAAALQSDLDSTLQMTEVALDQATAVLRAHASERSTGRGRE